MAENSKSGFKVKSLNKLTKINASSDAFIYYTNLSKEWACKINGTVDGEEYSSKYYAQQASEAVSEANDYINETKANFRQGIGLVKASADNAIKTSADGIYVDLTDLENDISSADTKLGDLNSLTTDTKTNIVQAINEHETLLNQKVDINSKVVDGRWGGVSQQILGQTNLPAATGISVLGTYDLSQYFPNDNYTYEVQMNLSFRTISHGTYASVTIVGEGMIIIHGMAYCMLNSNDVVQLSGIGMVGANKTITISYNAAQGAQIDYLNLVARRRLGTNE